MKQQNQEVVTTLANNSWQQLQFALKLN